MDRQSDDSSRRADSDSHPENWTDHEANDPPNYIAGSPPKSEQPNKSEGPERRSRLFARDRGTPGSNKSKKHSLSVDLKPSADLNSTEVITSNNGLFVRRLIAWRCWATSSGRSFGVVNLSHIHLLLKHQSPNERRIIRIDICTLRDCRLHKIRYHSKIMFIDFSRGKL